MVFTIKDLAPNVAGLATCMLRLQNRIMWSGFNVSAVCLVDPGLYVLYSPTYCVLVIAVTNWTPVPVVPRDRRCRVSASATEELNISSLKLQTLGCPHVYSGWCTCHNKKRHDFIVWYRNKGVLTRPYILWSPRIFGRYELVHNQCTEQIRKFMHSLNKSHFVAFLNRINQGESRGNSWHVF